FYTQNIIRKVTTNTVFYTKKNNEKPIYSYIQITSNNKIINIQEKIKISNNANTGAYAFNDIKELSKYCKHVIDNNITFN
ncbi:hypothetical protein, partial [Bacillus altitudinis]|uniref:hypothetical protein n=1 Tax=Bacillus altitudinis TaxID=293387 RepID=UPI002F95F267